MLPIKFLNKILKIKIDRPLGSKHPKHKNITYEVNYGFIPDTIGGDNEEIDCYLLGVEYPVEEFEGKCIAVIKRLSENDDKLIIVPKHQNYTDDEIEAKVKFQEKYFEHVIIR